MNLRGIMLNDKATRWNMKEYLNFTFKKIYNVFGNYWTVRNYKNEMLGTVSFNNSWNIYAWRQCRSVVMSPNCLRKLADSMEKLKSK